MKTPSQTPLCTPTCDDLRRLPAQGARVAAASAEAVSLLAVAMRACALRPKLQQEACCCIGRIAAAEDAAAAAEAACAAATVVQARALPLPVHTLSA